MDIDERLDKITQTLEFVATLQRSNEEHIIRLIEQGDTQSHRMDALTDRMDLLAGRTIQAMDAINRLARIADNH